MRLFTTILEVAGLLMVAAGAWTVSYTVGLLVSGAAALLLGYLLEGVYNGEHS